VIYCNPYSIALRTRCRITETPQPQSVAPHQSWRTEQWFPITDAPVSSSATSTSLLCGPLSLPPLAQDFHASDNISLWPPLLLSQLPSQHASLMPRQCSLIAPHIRLPYFCWLPLSATFSFVVLFDQQKVFGWHWQTSAGAMYSQWWLKALWYISKVSFGLVNRRRLFAAVSSIEFAIKCATSSAQSCAQNAIVPEGVIMYVRIVEFRKSTQIYIYSLRCCAQSVEEWSYVRIGVHGKIEAILCVQHQAGFEVDGIYSLIHSWSPHLIWPLRKITTVLWQVILRLVYNTLCKHVWIL
jgi:hypothetical protein